MKFFFFLIIVSAKRLGFAKETDSLSRALPCDFGPNYEV